MNKFLATSNLIPAYQPIVEIDTRAVVGFEALARWPTLAGATPDLVFAEARETGFLVELDWACRLAAVKGAIDFGFGVEHTLFVNVEPDTIGRQVPTENLLALEGAHCISLGVQTPIRDIALAATAQRAQVVALSFSAAFPLGQVIDGLADLRARLPPQVEIWAGGSAMALTRRLPEGVHSLLGLEAIHHQIEAWRARAQI